MRIRNHRSSSSICALNIATATAETLKMSEDDDDDTHAFALRKYRLQPSEETLGSINPHHQEKPSWSDSSSVEEARQKPVDKLKADDTTANGEAMLALPFYFHDNITTGDSLHAIQKQPDEYFRVCTMNMSPWDVPSFVTAFDTEWRKADNDTENGGSRKTNRTKIKMSFVKNPLKHNGGSRKKARTKIKMSFVNNSEKQTSKPKQTVNVKDEAKNHGILRVVNERNPVQTNTKNNKFMQLQPQEVMIESALKSAFSEAGNRGLTVREAACRLLNLGEYDSGGLPLSVQVRKVMLNSPYFVELDDGRFALWDDFLKSSISNLDDKSSQGLVGSREEGTCHKLADEQRSPAAKDEIYKDVVASPKTKGKRSVRLGLVRQDQKSKDMGILGVCKQAEKDGKGWQQCGDGDHSYHKIRKINSNEDFSGFSDCKAADLSSQCKIGLGDDDQGETFALKKRRTICLLEKFANDVEDGQHLTGGHNKRKAVKARSLRTLF